MDTKFTLKELKDRLTNGDLDLSLSSLTEDEIPIQQMKKLSKVNGLDLSCNVMATFPVELCTFSTINSLDLSKNMITVLPEEFGQLRNLKRLDLLGNELKTLPESFGNLKSLSWLDLKDNPWNPALQQQVGDCLDEIQCKRCAKRIVKLMADVHEHRSKQRQLAKETAEKEAKEKAEQEALRKRREKEELKRKRKKESEARKAEQASARRPDGSSDEDGDGGSKGNVNFTDLSQTGSDEVGLSTFTIVLICLAALISCLLGIYFYCESNPSNEMCATPIAQQITSCVQYIINAIQQKVDSIRWLLEELYKENVNSGTFKLKKKT